MNLELKIAFSLLLVLIFYSSALKTLLEVFDNLVALWLSIEILLVVGFVATFCVGFLKWLWQ
jgi:hypothetical protein